TVAFKFAGRQPNGDEPLVTILRLRDMHGQLSSRDYTTGDAYLDKFLSGSPNESSSSRTIRSGFRGLATVFLQSYFVSPGPGMYEVRYEGSCPSPGPSDVTGSSGTFKFAVRPQAESDLQTIVNGLDKEFQTGDVDKAGAELTGMDTPLILPLLAERFD